MKTFLIILTVLIAGCGTASKLNTSVLTTENTKDVFILSNLIQEHLMRTGERELNLDELVQNDTLKRISENFQKVELKYEGGHISVYYVFSASRNTEIELTEAEKKTLSYKKIVVKDLDDQYDGEIQLEYAERFYHLKRIVVNEDREHK